MASPTYLVGPGASGAGLSVLLQGPKLTTIDLIGGIYCHICQLTFKNKKDYDAHYIIHNTGTTEIVYTCVACRKEITGYPAFRGHCYTNHVIKDRLKCEHCKKKFSKGSALELHINAMHTFKCSKQSCNKLFSSKKELYQHQIVHKNDGNKPPYPCQTCDEKIDNLDMCELHIDLHCILTYSCPICNENVQKENATQHLTQHFGDVLNDDIAKDDVATDICEDSSINILGGILCCVCNSLFKNRKEFDAHFTADHNSQTILYTCNICKKQFEKYNLFGDHCYNHLTKNKFECDTCDKSFNRLSLLVVHTEAFHAGRGDDKPFRCTQCGHGFRTYKRLMTHRREAHGTHSIACPEPGCGSTFTTPMDLIHHQKYHKTEVDKWCSQCGLQFSTLASCEKHLDVHKKKLFSCPVCDRSYGERYLLLKHIPQHFESVFHMCKVCGKVFNARNRLVEHAKTHSSIKNYECMHCGKGFLKESHWQQHQNIHTGAKPFHCVACPKTFAAEPNRNKHMRKMHNIDTKTINKKNDETGAAIIQNNNAKPICNDADAKNDISLSSKNQSFDFIESESSTMDSDSIVSAVIENETHILQTNVNSMNSNSVSAADLKTPDANAPFVAALPASLTSAEPLPPAGTFGVLREYGPDFVNNGLELTACTGGFIDLDDHILPHINPLLTINNEATTEEMYVQNLQNVDYDNFDQNIVETIETISKWEPPIITKIYGTYFGDLDDMSAGRLSVMNTDIF